MHAQRSSVLCDSGREDFISSSLKGMMDVVQLAKNKPGKWSLKNNAYRQNRTWGRTRQSTSREVQISVVQQAQNKGRPNSRSLMRIVKWILSLNRSLFPMNLPKAQANGQLMAPSKRRLLFTQTQKIQLSSEFIPDMWLLCWLLDRNLWKMLLVHYYYLQ